MRVLLLLLLVALLFQETDGKRKGSRKKTKIKEPSVVKTIKKALDPVGILNSKKEKSGTKDLAKITEDAIVNEHLRLSTQVMNWLHKVVDVGKGIANGVCRTVKLV
ncbi:hypothetical protein SKAU_G00264670 [Synaphobranchus kaupii]|uniref:Uncharacterized protein n=1 Tax=Synaphobranchus kaupii TaxID=118154 RepID=A0A9Q1IMW8_SYNKA|nr:hypothetical protein SKAU_G00264670 [Synaphobranchus kaupii]